MAGDKLNPIVTAKILAAARDCFERFGIGRTTMVDIAKGAGISRASVYNYFSTKEKIVEQISLDEIDEIYRNLRHSWKPGESFASRVTEALTLSILVAPDNNFVRWFIRDPELRRISQSQASDVSAAKRSRWTAMIVYGRETGEISSELSDDDIIFWLSFCNVALLFQMDHHPLDEERLRWFIGTFVVPPILTNNIPKSPGPETLGPTA